MACGAADSLRKARRPSHPARPPHFSCRFFMLKFLSCGLPYVMALLLSGPAVAGETLKDVLAKTAAAYGARPPAAKIERGVTTSFRRGEGALLRLYQAPDRFLIRIDYPNGAETRSLTGASAWQQGVPANPVLRGAIALQTARIALPWTMLPKTAAVSDLGMISTPDGKRVRAAELAMEDGLKIVVELDPDNGRMLRSRGIQTVGTGTMEFSTVYSDFRSTGGRLHAGLWACLCSSDS